MLRPPHLLRRRRRWLGIVALWLAAVTAVLDRAQLAAWLATDRGAPAAGAPVAFYTCAMDPSVESDHPGNCPVCGMTLTAVTEEDRGSGIVRIAATARERIGLVVAQVETRQLRTRIAASGTVVEPAVVEPAAGDRRTRLAGGGIDHASVVARVYRGDPGEVRAGMAVAVAVPDLPLIQLAGAITALPGEDAHGELRAVVDNPDDVLRPGMHVELQIDVERAPRLVVPAQAVLYAGARRIVFVDLGHGRYEPRPVTLGAQSNGFVEVIERLADSDRVVVRGTFLLAAESRIRSDGALWSDRKDPPIRRAERSKP